MKLGLLLCVLAVNAIYASLAAADAAAKETRFFELRTYYAAPGKLDALHARFRNHALPLFVKHGMTSIGYWVPKDNPDNRLVYLLAYPSREACEKSWAAFKADPDWLKAKTESEKDGKLVDKVESLFLNPTDFSPVVTPEIAAAAPRTFNLRIYTCTPNNLPNLLARFRNHTCGLFAKHGMTNVGYFTPADKDKGADNMLVYFLANKSAEADQESFKTFRVDPEWVKVRKESEERAGGSLTVPDGVKGTYLLPTEYSPMK